MEFRKCEGGGCQQYAEFYDPIRNRLCSDCIQRDAETGEYTWDECEAIPGPNSQQVAEPNGWNNMKPTDIAVSKEISADDSGPHIG